MDRHVDSSTYRQAAIRETFEESGILLARDSETGALIQIDQATCNAGRKAVHRGDVKFTEWLKERGAVPDVETLIPFTRWITPPHLPKRFTTQMYVYFMPISKSNGGLAASMETGSETVIRSSDPTPTSDGGIEHTAARFLPASEWLSLARRNDIILFEPQMFLLHMLSQFLPSSCSSSVSELERQRDGLVDFIKNPEEKPSWAQKCISPQVLFTRKAEGLSVLSLAKPGPEAGSDRAGVHNKVILVNFSGEGPRNAEVRDKREILEEERHRQSKEKL